MLCHHLLAATNRLFISTITTTTGKITEDWDAKVRCQTYGYLPGRCRTFISAGIKFCCLTTEIRGREKLAKSLYATRSGKLLFISQTVKPKFYGSSFLAVSSSMSLACYEEMERVGRVTMMLPSPS